MLPLGMSFGCVLFCSKLFERVPGALSNSRRATVVSEFGRRNRVQIMNVLVESGIWDGVLHSIRRNLNRETFDTWFKPIQFEGIDNSHRIIRLRAPN